MLRVVESEAPQTHKPVDRLTVIGIGGKRPAIFCFRRAEVAQLLEHGCAIKDSVRGPPAELHGPIVEFERARSVAGEFPQTRQRENDPGVVWRKRHGPAIQFRSLVVLTG